MDFPASIKIKFLICAVIIIILTIGLYFRIAQNNPAPFLTNNVIAYYFSISERFNLTGDFPKTDDWLFAPLKGVENVPPFLAYFSVYFYKVAKVFYPLLSFLNFAFLLPPIIFLIWAISGSLLIKKLFNSRWATFIFLLLLSFLPVSIELTKFGHYTEEFLGAFFVFLAFLFFLLWEKEMIKIFYVLSFITLVFFVLTWQQFHLIYAILTLVALLNVKEKRVFFGILFLIFGSLLAAQALSILVLHSAYSPLVMIREAYLGIIHYKSEFIQIAMRRGDWNDLTLWRAINSFQLAGWFFWLVGFLFILAKLKEKLNICLLFSGLLSLGIMVFFVKSRFLALPFFVIIGSLGGKILIENKSIWVRGEALLEKLIDKLKFKYLAAAILLIFLVIFVAKNDWLVKPSHFPKPEIQFYQSPAKTEIGKAYQVGIQLTNKGAAGLKEEFSFSGLHIEIENAEVKDIKAYSSFTKSTVVIKPDAQRGNIYWFEAKYNFLDKEQWGRVEFTLIPKEKEVNIWYRGWIPGPCTLIERVKFFPQLQEGYKDFFKNSWRSEKCILRAPANAGEDEPFCQIKVFAAHEELQDFRCFNKSIGENNL